MDGFTIAISGAPNSPNTAPGDEQELITDIAAVIAKHSDKITDASANFDFAGHIDLLQAAGVTTPGTTGDGTTGTPGTGDGTGGDTTGTGTGDGTTTGDGGTTGTGDGGTTSGGSDSGATGQPTGTAGTSADFQPLYLVDGDVNADPAGWSGTAYVSDTGRPLFTFNSDAATVGSPATGDGLGGIWHVYSGAVNTAP